MPGLTPWMLMLSMPLAIAAEAQVDAVSQWGEAAIIGQLDSAMLPEASGLAASRDYPGRLYHINDSGSSPALVLTAADGSAAKNISLDIARVTDTEDLVVGPCPDQGSCVYIGDIGDNKRQRPYVTVHVVRESAIQPGIKAPLAFSVNLSYPGAEPHNAEGLAMHPSGYLYLLTKENPASLFRFPVDAIPGRRQLTLEAVATISLTPWLDGTDRPNKLIPTALAIRHDGMQMVILTRAAGLSINWDFLRNGRAPVSLNELADQGAVQVERLPMITVPQAEAVTYVDGEDSVIYSSEVGSNALGSVPLVRIAAGRERS